MVTVRNNIGIMDNAKDKKVSILSGIVNNGNSASWSASKLPKTPAKASYSFVGDLHSMQLVRGSSPFGSIRIFGESEKIYRI